MEPEEDLENLIAEFLQAFLENREDDVEGSMTAYGNLLSKLGMNLDSLEDFYSTMQDFRDSLISDPVEQRRESLEIILKFAENFIRSQNGLEDFMTNESQKNDSDLAPIYAFFEKLEAGGQEVIEDPEKIDEYFGTDTAAFFTKFALALITVIAEAEED